MNGVKSSQRPKFALELKKMEKEMLTERYAEKMEGVLECYDRLIITGHLHPFCYPEGMTSYLYRQGIRIFDYLEFAQGLRETIRENAEKVACENGLEIEFIRKQNFRKENRIQEILKERGKEPGIVHIFSAMEACTSYQPWHNKSTGKTYVKTDGGKCLHYYFYFIDPELGLCYLRVPTWCPFRLQFYCNGHEWLAHQLTKHGVEYQMLDNAFLHIADYELANQLAQQLDVAVLHQRLNCFSQQYCPVIEALGTPTDLVQQPSYHWSIMQAEYARDLIFKRQDVLQAFYQPLLEILIQAVKPADIATFLGRKLNGNYQGEMGNRFNKRLVGTRIKHFMGPVSIKMYDKAQLILRIETTVNNVSFFKHYRQVNHRDGSSSNQWAPMKKSIYSLPALQECLSAANQRYLAFISQIATPEIGTANLRRLTQSQIDKDHSYKGFNLLSEEDSSLFRSLANAAFMIHGFANRDLRTFLSGKSSAQITRLIKRLRVHCLIKKATNSYHYYLTSLGRQVVAAVLKLREVVLVPAFAHLPAA